MKYVEYKPADALKKYIDAYWVAQTGSTHQPYNRPIFADACTEIFINYGNSRPSFNGTFHFLPGHIYLGGTMSSHGYVSSVPDSCFIGIRFRPGGLPVFYRLPLIGIVDEIIEFPDPALYAVLDIDDSLPQRLDQYFLQKKNEQRSIIAITEAVQYHKGLITVDALAQQHNVSHRTLERLFQTHMGIPPKEFIKVIRFQQLLPVLKKNRSGEKLLHIAFEMGYYDDSHLSREVKKYSGLTPAQLAGL